MKKAILAAALGIVASITPSYGQGSIFFNNYGASTDAIVTWGTGWGTLHSPGEPFGPEWNATLWYQFGGGPLTALGNVTAFNPAIPGYFTGPIVTIPPYTGGAISFQIQVYNGVYNIPLPLFTLPSIATGTQPVGEFGPAFKPFQFSVPEPSTIALVGLGLVSMLVYRWRKS